jgi:hypothetical protein
MLITFFAQELTVKRITHLINGRAEEYREKVEEA